MWRLRNVFLNDVGVKRCCGFTLVEVLVAMAVLSVAAVASGYYYGALSAMKRRERETVRAVVLATEYVENAVAHPPMCVDTAFSVPLEPGVNLAVEVALLPGGARLARMDVSPVVGEAFRRLPVVFGRIVFCE